MGRIDHRTFNRRIFKRMSEWKAREQGQEVSARTLAARFRACNPETVAEYEYMEDVMRQEMEATHEKIARIAARAQEAAL
ncbi:MAG: hypothetical protein WCH05_06690 [Chlorobiaceae bacterium]